MSGTSPTPLAGAPTLARQSGFELRLEQGRAVVRLVEQVFLPGVRLAELLLDVPGVRFPFDVAAGAAQFRQHLCDLQRLELAADAPAASAFAGRLALAGSGLSGVAVALRAGFAELGGRVEGGTAFTVKIGAWPDGERGLRLVAYAPRAYGPAPFCDALLPFLLSRAAASLGRAEGNGLSADPLSAALRRLLPSRGWKLPRTEGARLALAAFEPGRLRLAWGREGASPAEVADPELHGELEGARAFVDGEAWLSAGEVARARETYLAYGPRAAEHPFGAARLLSLLCADQAFHEEALDLAAGWLERRPDFAPALLAEARVRTARGEASRASEAWARLAAAAARAGEELAALCAADACLALGERAAPASAARAIEVALGLRRDHLPALRALLALGERGGDRETLLRACRRLAAYSPEDGEKAAAHATLGRLLLRADPAAARLHLDHALRLSPSDPDTAEALARACDEVGEHLRAVRAWDRSRELRLSAGDRAGAARAAAAVGALWHHKLLQPENALLRYREAADLLPGPEAHERAAQLASDLGHWAEAGDRWAAVLETGVGATAPGEVARAARARRALAGIAEERLGEPGRAADHLEAAVLLEPGDLASLQRLADLYARLGRTADRISALDRLAERTPEAPARARLLAEAARLAAPAEVRRRWEAVLALAPEDGEALRALAEAGAAEGDLSLERSALSRLAALPGPAEERGAVLDRLVSACRRAGDAEAALQAATAARRAHPTPARFEAEVALATGLGHPALAAIHAEQAGALAATDPAGAAHAWLLRARLLAGADEDEALASLAEARLLTPVDPEVLAAQADGAERRGDASLALDALGALAALRPGDGDLRLRLARAALQAGDGAGARDHAEEALRLAAPGAEALRAEIVALLARPEAAALRAAEAEALEAPAERLAALREALDLDGACFAALRALCAEPVARLLAPAERADLLARLAGHPEVTGFEAAAAHAARARALREAGDRAGALAAAREAARREPGDAAVLGLLAEMAEGVDAGASAEALLARAALARDAGDPESALHLAAAGQAALAAGLADGGRWALREALRAGLDREDSVTAWQGLAAQARAGGDGAVEREALQALVPLLPTGEKPAALLRLAALSEEAGDPAAAREATEQARRLSPRDPAAVGAALAAAERAGDPAAAAERLAELAELEPASAGPRLLARARLLRDLGRAEEADDAMTRALALLPPDAALAAEQARLRREAPATPGQRPWGEPLEAFARRAPPREAAAALRDAAALALQQGDAGAALRCARRAHELAGADPAFAGPLLARLLYREGAGAEALALHRRLLEEALPSLDERGQVRVCRRLAELAEDAGEPDLALRALAMLLELRPWDAESALSRFRLEPDRRRAVNELAERAQGWRSARRKVGAWARAAAAAARELQDPALADALWRRARGAAGDYPALLSEVEELRLDAARADADPEGLRPPAELLEALHDAAEARAAAGQREGAARLLAEAADLAARHGLAGVELADRRRLDEVAPPSGGESADRARARGLAALRAGEPQEAEANLRRALEQEPDAGWADGVSAALGQILAGRGEVAEALALATRRAERARARGDVSGRREALEAALALSGRLGDRTADAALLESLAGLALSEGDPRGEELAERAVEALGRAGENARATALFALAAGATQGPARARWLARAAHSAGARGDRAAARAAVAEALVADPSDQALREAHLDELEAAGLDEALGRALAGALEVPGADRAPLLARLASVRRRLGDVAGADAALADLVALGPGAPGWREAAVELERRWRDGVDPRALGELRLRLAEASEGHEERAEILAAAAQALLRGGATAEARAAARRACEVEPDAPGPWRALALVEDASANPGEAASARLAAALRSEGLAAAQDALEAARLFEAAGRPDDAARAHAAAAAVDPGSVPARRALAARAVGRGDAAEAAHQLLALDRDRLPREERPDHDRALARALSAAGRPEAEGRWRALFDADAGDAEAFDALAGEARRQKDGDRWMRLAAIHDGALAAGDPDRRRDLRCARAALLEERGQTDAAEGAWHAALAIDPGHRPALAALRRLVEARGDAATAAELAAREATLEGAPGDAARLLLEEARLRLRVRDLPGARAALGAAAARTAASPAPEDAALGDEARRRLAELEAPPPAPRTPPPVPAPEEPVPAGVRTTEPEFPPPVPLPLPPHTTAPEFPGLAALPEPGAPGPAEAGAPPPVAPELPDAAPPPGQRPITAPQFLAPGPPPEAAAGAEAARATAPGPAAPEPPAAPGPGLPHTTEPEFPPAPEEIAIPAQSTLREHAPLLDDADVVEVPGAEAPSSPGTLAFYELEPRPPPPAPGPAPAAVDPALEYDPDPGVDDRLRFLAEASEGAARADALGVLARRLERRGDRAAAADALAAAALAHPPAAEARLEGLLFLVEKDRPRLLGAHRLRARLASSARARAAALTELAHVLASERDGLGEAIEVLERVLAVEPRNGQAAAALARAFLATGQPERALDLLGRIDGEAEGLSRQEAVQLEREAARAAGDAPLGLERARRAARGAPMDAGLQELWASAADEAGAPGEAAEAWAAALAAEPGAPPGEESRRRRALAGALERAGRRDEALREILLAAQRRPQDGELLAAASAALEAAGRPGEALALGESAARLCPDGSERAARLSALAARAEELGDRAQALWLWEGARAASPRDPGILGALVRLQAAGGDPVQLAALARDLEAAAGAGALAPHAAVVGRALLAAGDAEGAFARLSQARAATPADLPLVEDLARAAERLGRVEDQLLLGEELAAAAAAGDPSAAAARYRQLAALARDRAGDPARAAALLRRAAALAPEDEAIQRELAAAEPTPAASLEAALQRARLPPVDAGALAALARAFAAGGADPAARTRAELGRSAAALAAFVDPALPEPPPPPLALRVGPEVRARAALPAAAGPTARLLALLAPWLEPLFPADVARRGVAARHRIGPGRAPALELRLGAASRALGARRVVAFLPDQGGWDTALENTQPPSLVIGPRLVRELRESAVDFALARALCLAEAGHALLGKFAPRDVAILCELACRFGGGSPPELGLPAARAHSFLEALHRLVPPSERERAGPLAREAADELRGLDPRDLQLAVRRTAARQALLWSGDPLGALEALAAGRRREGQPDPLADRAAALSDPDLADLCAFALSDLYAELRAAAGAAP